MRSLTFFAGIALALGLPSTARSGPKGDVLDDPHHLALEQGDSAAEAASSLPPGSPEWVAALHRAVRAYLEHADANRLRGQPIRACGPLKHLSPPSTRQLYQFAYEIANNLLLEAPNDPNSPVVVWYRARALDGLGRTDEAFDSRVGAVNSLSDGPLKAAIFMEIGDFWAREREHYKMLLAYQRSLELADTELAPFALLGMSRAAILLEDPPLAGTVLERFAESPPAVEAPNGWTCPDYAGDERRIRQRLQSLAGRRAPPDE